MNDPIGDEMNELGRGVEAAVRVPPYELVVRRLHRRRRRHAGAGGVLLAALVTAGVVVLPQLGDHRSSGDGVQPISQVTVAPPTGKGTLSLSDVSYDADEHGLVLGRRCSDSCHDVVLLTADRGKHYGPEVEVPGDDRYVAAGPDVDVVYGPDLAVSHDQDKTWTALVAPAPVADVAFASGQMTVLVTPAGARAAIYTGPQDATSWSQLRERVTVPGSDDSARLAIAGSLTLVVSNSGTPRLAVYDGFDAGPAVQDVGICVRGSQASVAPASQTTWWVACRNETDGSHETIVITTDAGRTYTAVSAPPTSDLGLSVVAVSARTAYLYGGPALYETTDGGATWQTVLPHPGLGPPHVPPGHGTGDVWVLAPGANTVWRQLAHGAFGGYQAT